MSPRRPRKPKFGNCFFFQNQFLKASVNYFLKNLNVLRDTFKIHLWFSSVHLWLSCIHLWFSCIHL